MPTAATVPGRAPAISPDAWRVAARAALFLAFAGGGRQLAAVAALPYRTVPHGRRQLAVDLLVLQGAAIVTLLGPL